MKKIGNIYILTEKEMDALRYWNGSYLLSCMQECFLKTLINVIRKMKPF